jgi:hypothetical protein
MALVMGVVSPYWMKSIDPSVAAVRTQNTAQAASASHSSNPAKTESNQNVAFTADGQK